MTTDTLKASIIAALRDFVHQRPGIEPGNYGSYASYRAESRSVTQDKHDALALISAVEECDGISGADLQKAFSGRLSCETAVSPDGCTAKLEYCTGQYFPTEYRKAAARVCATALWEWRRARPEPAEFRVEYLDDDNEVCQSRPFATREEAEHFASTVGRSRAPCVTERYALNGKKLSPGDWLRAKFRAEFGARIAKRYFN